MMHGPINIRQYPCLFTTSAPFPSDSTTKILNYTNKPVWGQHCARSRAGYRDKITVGRFARTVRTEFIKNF